MKKSSGDKLYQRKGNFYCENPSTEQKKKKTTERETETEWIPVQNGPPEGKQPADKPQ